MRLFLSSYKLGDHREVLSGMVRGERHGLVIANALDGLDEARRHRDTEREIEELAQLGLVAHDFDLREHDPGRSFTMSARRVERAGPSVLPTSHLPTIPRPPL